MTIKTALKYGKILKVKVNSTSKERVLEFVRGKITKKHKFLIVTPNPEIVLQAQKDPLLMKIINSADLCLADGTGLVWAARILSLAGPQEAIRGREMFFDLCQLANKNNWQIYFLGGQDGVAYRAAQKLGKKFKNLKIANADGPMLDKQANPILEVDRKIEKDVVAHINKVQPQILFVGFGAPKQEKWLAKWLAKLKIGGAMVVGGSFDYYSGKAKLPPQWLADLGFEWLWRLFFDPKRLPRILKATVIFPLIVLQNRFFNKTS
jgi:N-acetylglucosaminyldiphosphoundecaprenol N-acetyl-beta-D-mannosaminyltransferase